MSNSWLKQIYDEILISYSKISYSMARISNETIPPKQNCILISGFFFYLFKIFTRICKAD